MYFISGLLFASVCCAISSAAPTETSGATGNSTTVPHESCGLAKTSEVINLQITPCTSSERCQLPKGSDVTIYFNFTGPVGNAKSPERVIYAVLDKGGNGTKSIEVNWGGVQPACENIQGPQGWDCAKQGLLEGQLYSYKTAFNVMKIYPSIKLDVRLILRESSGPKKLTRKQKADWRAYPGKPITCITVPVEVVDA